MRNLMNKLKYQNRDILIERRQDSSVGDVCVGRYGGTEQKRVKKRAHGHGQRCGDCAGGGGGGRGHRW